MGDVLQRIKSDSLGSCAGDLKSGYVWKMNLGSGKLDFMCMGPKCVLCEVGMCLNVPRNWLTDLGRHFSDVSVHFQVFLRWQPLLALLCPFICTKFLPCFFNYFILRDYGNINMTCNNTKWWGCNMILCQLFTVFEEPTLLFWRPVQTPSPWL